MVVEIWKLERRIVATKNDYDPCALLAKAVITRKCSNIWKNIISFVMPTNKFFLKVITNLEVVGDGTSILFWHDAWLKDMILKVEFLRLFTLALNKEGRLCEYGQWSKNRWQWQIELKRQLFG